MNQHFSIIVSKRKSNSTVSQFHCQLLTVSQSLAKNQMIHISNHYNFWFSRKKCRFWLDIFWRKKASFITKSLIHKRKKLFPDFWYFFSEFFFLEKVHFCSKFSRFSLGKDTHHDMGIISQSIGSPSSWSFGCLSLISRFRAKKCEKKWCVSWCVRRLFGESMLFGASPLTSRSRSTLSKWPLTQASGRVRRFWCSFLKKKFEKSDIKIKGEFQFLSFLMNLKSMSILW